MQRYRKIVVFLGSVFLCLLVIGAVLLQKAPQSIQTMTGALPIVILDAGHGGFDGGTSTDSGILEKDLNLAVAQELQIELLKRGWLVVMTRDSDTALSQVETTIRKAKQEDLNARLAVMRQHPDAVFVSIHMNYFTQPQYRGAQIFYSVTADPSRLLADAIRQSLQEHVDPDNAREIKPVLKDIFLLSKAPIPAVLIECGFLSNPDEARRLQSPDYQKQLASAIACGLETYFMPE